MASHFNPQYLLKIIYFHADLHMNIYNCFICSDPNWKLFKCPSASEWINRLSHIHIMKHNLTFQRKELWYRKHHQSQSNFPKWKKQANKQKKAYTLIQFICCCLVAGLCQPLCDNMFYSPPGSSLRGISQARILKSVDIFVSRGSSWPGIECMSLVFPDWQADSLPLSHLESTFDLYKILEMEN